MVDNLTPENIALLSKINRYWVKRSQKRPSVLPSEQLLLQSSEHWIKYVLPTFVALILTGMGIVLVWSAVVAANIADGSLLIFCIGLGVLTAVFHWYFWFLLAEFPVDIIVTNKRVIYVHSGLLWGEDLVEIAFDKLKAVQAHKKNLFQSIFNYGTLDFEGKVKIKRVPHPGTVARVIQQAMGMA